MKVVINLTDEEAMFIRSYMFDKSGYIRNKAEEDGDNKGRYLMMASACYKIMTAIDEAVEIEEGAYTE